MMQKYNKEEMWLDETECYGCENMTTNESGMCDDCGGRADTTESERPVRKVRSLSQAYDIIEKGAQM